MGNITDNHREVLFAKDAVTGTPFPIEGNSATGAIFVDAEGNESSASTAAVTSVNDTASSTTLIAANTSRKEVIVANDSSSTLYLKLGTTASSTSYTAKLATDDIFITTYTGRIDGIWSSDSTGAARITELT
jgi:hypothetical protein